MHRVGGQIAFRGNRLRLVSTVADPTPRSNSTVLVTFANGNYMPMTRIRAQAESLRVFDEVRTHTEHDFPAFFSQHRAFIRQEPIGFGRWIWKPKVILETLLSVKPGDIVVYADAGVYLNTQGLPRFSEYIAMLEDPAISVVTFATHFAFDVKYLLPETIATYFPSFSYETHPYQYAGILMMKRTDAAIQMVREWLSLCESYPLLRNPDGDGDNGLFNLCLAKHSSIVRTLSDEVNTPDGDWSKLDAFPFQIRRIRPRRF